MNRRLFVAAVATGAVGASAGCLSDILDDVTTFEAEPARVTEDAADEAEYEYQGTVERVESEEYGGQDVEVTTYISEYTRPIDLPTDAFGGEVDAGIFAVVSTPQIHVAGEDFNPVGDMSEADLAGYVQDEYDELEVERNVGGRAIQADDIDGLDAAVRFDTFEGTATLQGETGVDVLVDVAQPDHGDDHLVVIAVYPDDEDLPIEGNEAGRVDTLTEGLEHGEDVEVEIVDDEEVEADDGDGDSGGNGDEDDDSDEGGDANGDEDGEGNEGEGGNETGDANGDADEDA